MIQFQNQEDRKFFEDLLMFESHNDINDFESIFDFRSPDIKRKEFNKSRNKILEVLKQKHGMRCMLNFDCCDIESGIAIDHIIPISSNKLNKELRNLQPEKGRKVKTQSFGSNQLANLILACNNCNNHKKHRFLDRKKIRIILKEKKEFKFQSPDLEKTEKPLQRNSFHLDFEQFESLRLYHALADDRVKYAQPLIKDIANKAFRNDLNILLGILNNANIEKHYLSGTPDYNPELEIQTLFLNFNRNSLKGIYPTLELFLANDGGQFTIREYYYANAANCYTIDIESNKKLIRQLKLLIKKYTTFNEEEKTWL